MIKSGIDITFAAPSGWQEFREGNRLVFQRTGEELIISGSKIEGHGPEEEILPIKEQLFEKAVTAVKQAAAHPELRVTGPLKRDFSNQWLECWTLSAQTLSGDTLFYESIVRTGRSVVLITYEAPHTPDAAITYRDFIRSIRPK